MGDTISGTRLSKSVPQCRYSRTTSWRVKQGLMDITMHVQVRSALGNVRQRILGGRGNIEVPAATNFGQENRIGSEHLSEGYPLDKQWG